MCVFPGTKLQVLVAVLCSLVFIKVYDVYNPFLDSFSGFSKNLAQWQYFGVFSLVLLLKGGFIGDENNVWVIFFFFVALFANAAVDAFYLLQAALSTSENAQLTRSTCGTTTLMMSCFRGADGTRSTKRVDETSVVIDEVEMPARMARAAAANNK